MNKNKHLLSDERIRIEELLKEGRSFKAIANELGKSPTTVSREIRSHTITKNVGSPGCPYNNCKHRFSCTSSFLCKECGFRRFRSHCNQCKLCNSVCSRYVPDSCRLLGNLPMFVMAVQNVTAPVLYRSISMILFLRKSSTKRNCLKPDQVFP